LPWLNGIRRTNIRSRSYPVTVYDICNHEEEFVLEKSGFQIVSFSLPAASWTVSGVRDYYLPAVSSWLQEYFHANKVLVYAYQFRCKDNHRSDAVPWINPYMRAHADITTYSNISRLRLHLLDEAEQIMKGRYRFINVWRAISGPEQDVPLALCDFRTVSEEDLVGADVVFPHYCDEGYEVRYNPEHRWFYKRAMSVDEVVMFKLWDSSDEEAKCEYLGVLNTYLSLLEMKAR